LKRKPYENAHRRLASIGEPDVPCQNPVTAGFLSSLFQDDVLLGQEFVTPTTSK
jgi:hypothetical protein